jgi:hypothetical protein
LNHQLTLPIAVKYIGRAQSRSTLGQLGLLTGALLSLWRLLADANEPDPEGLRRAASGTLQGWLVNDLEPNQRLRRYVARGLAWPAIDPTSRLSDVADNITFF